MGKSLTPLGSVKTTFLVLLATSAWARIISTYVGRRVAGRWYTAFTRSKTDHCNPEALICGLVVKVVQNQCLQSAIIKYFFDRFVPSLRTTARPSIGGIPPVVRWQ